MPQDLDPVNRLVRQAIEVVRLYGNVRETLPLPQGSQAEEAWQRVDKEIGALRAAIVHAVAQMDKEVGRGSDQSTD